MHGKQYIQLAEHHIYSTKVSWYIFFDLLLYLTLLDLDDHAGDLRNQNTGKYLKSAKNDYRPN